VIHIFQDGVSEDNMILKQPVSRKASGIKMRKIIMFILLCATFTTDYALNTRHKNENDTKILRLTRNEKITESIKSPNGKWIVFVKKSNFTIPSNCFYPAEKGEQANEIWIINTKEMSKKLLVAPHFNCGDVSRVIIDPHNLQFSPDSRTIFFETSAWVTSGDIIINQHRYRFEGDTPLGSYNWDWLFTPEGKQIRLYKKV